MDILHLGLAAGFRGSTLMVWPGTAEDRADTLPTIFFAGAVKILFINDLPWLDRG